MKEFKGIEKTRFLKGVGNLGKVKCYSFILHKDIR